MSKGIRLILASTGQDLISSVKRVLERKAYVESIITVSRIADAENKLSRNGVNVLIWDLDDFRTNQSWVESLQNRFALYTLYTSFNGSHSVHVLKSGYDEFLPKPPIFTSITTERYASNIEKHLDNLAKRQRPPVMRELVKMVGANDKQKIVAIASSTGGTNALEEIIRNMPDDIPPILVVQHMPSGFTKLFADRLNSNFRQTIQEAQSGDYLMHGKILLAPADRHMILTRHQGKLAVDCYVGNRIHGVMPAADILFDSVAEVMKSNAVGVVLTGMGNDGAKGLLKMRLAGSKNIGQNEESCVVYGMPKAANDLGAIDYELPLNKIPEMIMRLVNS